MDHATEPAYTPEGEEELSSFDWNELREKLVSYLGVIRRRLAMAVLFFLVFAIAGFIVGEQVLHLLTTRHPDPIQLIFLGPTEAFIARIKIALGLGFIGSFPFLLGQIWSLGAPFMNKGQRIASFALIPVSYGLFLAGTFVAFQGLLPVALRFLLAFQSEELEALLSVSPYISFVIFLVLPTAIIFQMPIVIMFLARIGVLRPETLAERRKYAILAFFVVGAILTPPDVFSQVLLALPLWLLYEISLLFARIAAPRRRGEDETGGEGSV